ncbi:MAG: sugar phosphate isomerase/epimerase [Algibacter sp.]|uniref:sugar phosphate isomerase/epimerase family protein n=1 Tax=Algibacter sp. TaxID=1872428 RepID=UPI00261728A7|nr:sugar phosphate isomerase/epimerase family protein [Algibacter sp.]MDG1728415.1 sugar phosphate isomerase/epimerase [Algibacter sp.]MDG2178101.1 sugar phosphate isomerase/epimerase [Algibacter sp.]
MKRRQFVKRTTQASVAVSMLGFAACKSDKKNDKVENEIINDETSLFFKMSLAEWSLHRTLFDKKMDHLDFAAKSRSFGFDGVEYVNGFFKDKAKDMSYLKEMKLRANAEGQQNVLIMIDGEGALANVDIKKRMEAIENHYKWVEAAHFLGCHAIRVNLAGGIDKKEAVKASVDSLNKLSEFAKGSNINILVENHGGFSSNGEWMQEVFSEVKNENCGTLPDFGNFCITKDKDRNCIEAYDRYKGMQELLPFAKAVSAKSYDFNEAGDDTKIDYYKIMKMVKDSGYKGFVGVEYEGNIKSEEEGIQLTRDLLTRVGKQLS